MGELYGTCALLAAVLFFVLLQKFESRFGKVDKEPWRDKETNGRPAQGSGENGFRPCKGQRGCNGRDFGQYGYTALCNRRIARFDSDSLEGRESCRRKTVEGIQPIMAETTPQKLNASLEKESAEVTLQETSQRLLSKYRLFPNGSRLIMKSLSVKIFSVRLVFLYSSSESASS